MEKEEKEIQNKKLILGERIVYELIWINDTLTRIEKKIDKCQKSSGG